MSLKPPDGVTGELTNPSDGVPDVSAGIDLQVSTYSSSLHRVHLSTPADVVFNSMNFSGCDPTGTTSSGTALDTAIALCIPSTDPATTTRQATRRLHIPPGTYMRNDGLPVLSLRSVQGFNLRTGGPSAVTFQQATTSRAVVEFNGISRCHIDAFTASTTGTPTVNKGVWIYWDNTGASATQAARSTLESRFEYIEVSSNQCIQGMQIGRDSDSNQVDSLSFGHALINNGSYATGIGTVAVGSSNVTAVTQVAGTFTAGQEITGYGIPASTRIRSFIAGTIVLEDSGGSLVVGTQNVTGTSLRSQSPTLAQAGVKVGHGVTGNNLLHVFGFLAVFGWKQGVWLTRSGLTILKFQPQANGSDFHIDGPVNGECKIVSGRSESSQRFVTTAGFGTAFSSATIEDMKFAAQNLHGDGVWIDNSFPGIFRVNGTHLASPPVGVVPKINAQPTRRQVFMAQGLSSEQAVDTAFTLGTNVSGSVDGYIQQTAAAVPAGTGIPTVATTGASLTIPPVDFILVSGTGNITAIPTGGHLGKRRTLMFTGAAAGTGLTAGSNLKIPANFVYTANDTYELYCDGTNFYACGPGSVNPP